MNHTLWTSLTILALFPGVPMAQGTSASAGEIVPRYDVEIIIFKNLKAPKSQEFVLPVSSPGKPERMLDLASPASVSAALEQGYELLPSTEFRLIDEATRLVESERYELLAHLAWRQPGTERETALPVWIRAGRIFGREYNSIDSRIGTVGGLRSGTTAEPEVDAGPTFDEQSLEALELQQQAAANSRPGLYELEGRVTIALSRYLHTHANLVLRRPMQSVDAVLNDPREDEALAEDGGDSRILVNHILDEQRRMRSKTLHYLDNPEFAMLVLITPYEMVEGFEEAPIEDTTSGESGN